MEENLIIKGLAEHIYLIIIGNKNQLDELIETINNYSNDKDEIYYSLRICDSISSFCNSLNSINITNNNKFIVLDEGVETAQTYSYADRTSDNLYMLMLLKEHEDNYTLGFPKFDLNKDGDLDKQIELWIKNKTNKIPKGIFKNLKILTIVGNKSNILIVTTRIEKKRFKF